jgi:hypothetical protein
MLFGTPGEEGWMGMKFLLEDVKIIPVLLT